MSNRFFYIKKSKQQLSYFLSSFSVRPHPHLLGLGRPLRRRLRLLVPPRARRRRLRRPGRRHGLPGHRARHAAIGGQGAQAGPAAQVSIVGKKVFVTGERVSSYLKNSPKQLQI